MQRVSACVCVCAFKLWQGGKLFLCTRSSRCLAETTSITVLSKQMLALIKVELHSTTHSFAAALMLSFFFKRVLLKSTL